MIHLKYSKDIFYDSFHMLSEQTGMMLLIINIIGSIFLNLEEISKITLNNLNMVGILTPISFFIAFEVFIWIFFFILTAYRAVWDNFYKIETELNK